MRIPARWQDRIANLILLPLDLVAEVQRIKARRYGPKEPPFSMFTGYADEDEIRVPLSPGAVACGGCTWTYESDDWPELVRARLNHRCADG